MESVIERITRGHFWQFHGGIHPPEQKFLTCTKPIAVAQIPEQLTLPLRQHIGQAGELLVAIGDKVLKGQALTKSDNPMSLPIHAPTSGTISDIRAAVIPHPSGLTESSIILTPDFEDTWRPRSICPDYQKLTSGQILEKIIDAGISGMGGAGFPTQVKVGTLAKINYLIINAAECEPYITADDLLIQEQCPTIIDGIKILDHLLHPVQILIAIEDNKAKAIKTLKSATSDIENIQVCVIPTKYPSGGEKQLIKILTGQEVPSGVLPSSLGIVMQNIATCYAVADAVINDSPLIKRVVTVSGQALEKPQNIWTLLGTPVGFLTKICGYQNKAYKHLVMGGPMMGFSLSSDQVPVVKTSNCILAPSEAEIASPYSTGSKEAECIRCGECADVCPAQLLPQELQWSAKAKDHQQLNKLNIFDCIECGACAYVCPSQIPLVHYYRVGKAEIRQQKLLDIKAEKAKTRFEARKLRLEREKLARAEKHKAAAEARKARMNADTSEARSETSAVAAALARVKAKKALSQTDENSPSPEQVSPTKTHTTESAEKSRVADAIARAKAKKLAQANNYKVDNTNNHAAITENSNENSNENNAEDKQTKVSAAVAKAKAKAKEKAQAKKLAATEPTQQTVVELDNAITDKPVTDSSVTDSSVTDSSVTNSSTAGEETTAQQRKAKIAASVAKAKAKKIAQEAQHIKEHQSTTHVAMSHASVDSADDEHSAKKVRIAAAIAKAKAKKLAATDKPQPTE